MKKLLMAAVLLAWSGESAMAQTEKGGWLVGTDIGNLGYNFPKGSGNRDFSISLQPNAGYFLANRLAVGTGIALSLYTYRNLTQKAHQFTSGLTPFVRYYFFERGRHKIYGQGSVAFYHSNYVTKNLDPAYAYADQKSNSSYWYYGASIGYNYFVTPSIALSASSYYYRGSNLNMLIGLQVFLPHASE